MGRHPVVSYHDAMTVRLARLLLPVVLSCTASVASSGITPGAVRVIPTHDLARDAEVARRLGAPLMIEFAADDCSYCRLLEARILEPMIRSGDYTRTVVMRSVDIDGRASLRDFDGKAVTGAALAQRYGVDLTPTLLFVDHRGRELSKRIVGIYSLDYFGGFVDDAIDRSRAKLAVRAAP